MEKQAINNELKKHTENQYLKRMLELYEEWLTCKANNEFYDYEADGYDHDHYALFDTCIAYIEQENFDITGWQLFEIPIERVYLFYHKSDKKSFDFIVTEDLTAFPAYVDNESNQQIAESIPMAIEQYNDGY